MENGIFEELMTKKLRHNVNKTKIKLCINNDMELYNHFTISINEDKSISNNGNGKINNEIIDYLIIETGNVPLKNSLIIAMETFKKINETIEFIEKLIKENIKEKLYIINKRIRNINRNSFILILIGMVLIGITQIFQIMERRYSLNEFVIVMSWVFMWKAVELIFFERVKLMKEKAILLKIFYSEIIIDNK
ncbi:hypothetical protein TREPR_3686 [Treponema primitia ZAS-2]|uniref:Uncharacterized protein n=1 Tax=Treponema primitia (strain ATCC BAA-887 / DSM 12427 / ZAS-2) TaxID=545694 RepID=F5YQE2_TREPZ|nr:hypothetical protein [Treponema primitia]AEF85768.1 hypothetical protein TREPR_3686 [Treponema primitia ZAS-2]